MKDPQFRNAHNGNHNHADAEAEEVAEEYFLATPNLYFPEQNDRNHDDCVFELKPGQALLNPENAAKNLLRKSVVMSTAITVAETAKLTVNPVPCPHFTTAKKKKFD